MYFTCIHVSRLRLVVWRSQLARLAPFNFALDAYSPVVWTPKGEVPLRLAVRRSRGVRPRARVKSLSGILA